MNSMNPRPFKAAEFVSNEKTPVIDFQHNDIHILSTSGRAELSVVGYQGKSHYIRTWTPESLLFKPVKKEIEVVILKDQSERFICEIKTHEDRAYPPTWRIVGTIKGEVET